MKEISVKELKILQDSTEEFFFLDVREENEFEHCNLGATLIPLGQVTERMSEIPTTGKIIVHCRSGGRSAQAAKQIIAATGNQDVYNVVGGILAYSDQVDSSIPKY